MDVHKLSIGIIGGGIGGVAAAVALDHAGIDATVYERTPELREVGAGMMLWPNAARVLKELGLLERVAGLHDLNAAGAFPAMLWLVSTPSIARLLGVELWLSLMFGGVQWGDGCLHG